MEIENGTMDEVKGTEIMVNIKQREAKIIKIGRKTFETQVDILKKKVEEKKITVKKYKEKVTKMREHMTISLESYNTQMHEFTTQVEKGEITEAEFETKTKVIKKRLKTTLKVQKIR